MSKNGCRELACEDAPKKMHFILREKKGTKSRDQKKFDVPEIKNYLSIILSGATWMALMATQFAPLQFFKKNITQKKFFLFVFYKLC